MENWTVVVMMCYDSQLCLLKNYLLTTSEQLTHNYKKNTANFGVLSIRKHNNAFNKITKIKCDH